MVTYCEGIAYCNECGHEMSEHNEFGCTCEDDYEFGKKCDCKVIVENPRIYT